MSSHRRERVAELLKSFLGEQLTRMVDPRLQGVTITDVEVSPDLRIAKIYWTTLLGIVSTGVANQEPEVLKKDDPRVREYSKSLENVKPLLKRRIGAELELRYVPDLLFFFDASSSMGTRIDYLLHKVSTGQS